MKLIPTASGASTRDLMAVISDLLKNMILSSSPPVCSVWVPELFLYSSRRELEKPFYQY